jgi:L-2-hydroxyglutarate oxidase LhgO
MEKIFQTGLENEIEGIEWITAEQVKEHEPYVESIGGIWVPCTGIIDFRAATEKMVELALALNHESKLVLGQEVTAMKRSRYTAGAGAEWSRWADYQEYVRCPRARRPRRSPPNAW